MALCWHRPIDADPEAGEEPELETGPADETSPMDGPLEEPEEGGEPPEPEEPSGLPDPSAGAPDVGDPDTPESAEPLPAGEGGDTLTLPEDRDWRWWLKYWWLLPLILFLMGFIALLMKILKVFGDFAGLVELLQKFWNALRDFLRGSTDTPPGGDGPEDVTPEEPEGNENDEACELVSQPRIILGEDGWVLLNPENDQDWGRLVHEFKIRADFAQHCKCCEYQQEIKGYFRERQSNGEWKDRELLLPRGKTLSPTRFEIDGKRQPDFEYGRRRRQGNREEDKYLPERDDGCEYQGYDLPGLGLEVGVQVDIDLTFRGRVIDRCRDRILWEYTWRLQTRGYIEREPPTSPGGRGLLVYREGELPGSTTTGTPTGGTTTTPGAGSTPTGGTTAGGPTVTNGGLPENLPWRSSVSDDDPCQAVKVQRMGGLLISCRGRCMTGGPCRLEKRPAWSSQNWRLVPGSLEVATPGFEYRCRC
ncbi:hypothetical protein AAJV73_09165 [Cyanobium sp. BSA11S]|uniref:hypothetical protein n=2 Tax=Synechococcales TaxID=1890424 RepID=UPI003D81598B